MTDLWSAIASLAKALHGDRIDAVATVVGTLATPSDFHRCRSTFGPGSDPVLIRQLEAAWLATPSVSGPEVASALRAAACMCSELSEQESADLVWTGPSTGLIPTRKTEQAMQEIVDASVHNLFLVSYVFYNASSVVSALIEAAARNVAIRILLESHIEHGGAVSIDGLGAMHQAVPTAELYTWTPSERAKSAGSLSAAVHAKCAVGDHRIAFITSANLTAAALERNMELGVILRGGTMPSRLHSHLNALVTTKIISRWQG
jgi:cardiolipin synthase A/B